MKRLYNFLQLLEGEVIPKSNRKLAFNEEIIVITRNVSERIQDICQYITDNYDKLAISEICSKEILFIIFNYVSIHLLHKVHSFSSAVRYGTWNSDIYVGLILMIAVQKLIFERVGRNAKKKW